MLIAFPRYKKIVERPHQAGQTTSEVLAMQGLPPPFPAKGLGQLLRDAQGDILQRWEHEIRRLPEARALPQPVLVDEIPALLDRIGQLAEALAAGRKPPPPFDLGQSHAHERLALGFDINAVVAEYAALRGVLTHWIWDNPDLADTRGVLLVINQAIDSAIVVSVERYTLARTRLLTNLERISTAAFGSTSLNDLLQRLLQTFIEATSSVDAAAILLRDGDGLRLRALAGGQSDRLPSEILPIGHGFAGTIAAHRRPMLLRDVVNSPMVDRRFIGNDAIKVVYGTPLIEGDNLVGVAHMGSLHAHDFSTDDRQLFTVLATRATSAIRLRQTEERLRCALAEADSARKRFEYLINHLDHAVAWEADAETLRLSFVSARVEKITGMTPEAWMNDPDLWTAHVPEEDRKILSTCLWRASHSQRDERCEHRFITADDRILWLQTGAHCVERDGRQYLQGLSLDVTSLREAVQARDHVMSIVSHDLRNPLNVIVMQTQLIARLLSEPLKVPPLADGIQVIKRSANRMARMVDDLVDITSIESGRLSLVLKPERPDELAAEAKTIAATTAREKQVHITVDVPSHLPRVLCDRDRILQVFSNLMNNALAVLEPGGKIHIAARVHEGGVRFSVSDTGPGIPTIEERKHVFDWHWRGGAVPYKGMGLGLAIVRGLVAAHGGRAWVESRPGTGATFFFTLPCETR